jgi:hypothetical protein
MFISTGGKSYQDSLAVDASISAGIQGLVWGASFSASAGYKEVIMNFIL